MLFVGELLLFVSEPSGILHSTPSMLSRQRSALFLNVFAPVELDEAMLALRGVPRVQADAGPREHLPRLSPQRFLPPKDKLCQIDFATDSIVKSMNTLNASTYD